MTEVWRSAYNGFEAGAHPPRPTQSDWTPDMSNLALPVMSYANLSHLTPPDRATTIAYATTAEIDEDGMITVRHHGNRIAVIAPDTLWLDTAGWDSQTTAMRLNRIAQDNGLPWHVAIRQGFTVLTKPGNSPRKWVGGSFSYPEEFERDGNGDWQRITEARHSLHREAVGS